MDGNEEPPQTSAALLCIAPVGLETTWLGLLAEWMPVAMALPTALAAAVIDSATEEHLPSGGSSVSTTSIAEDDACRPCQARVGFKALLTSSRGGESRDPLDARDVTLTVPI